MTEYAEPDVSSENAIAQALLSAERDRVPIPPPRKTMPGLDEAAAYRIQSMTTEAGQARGRFIAGRKIGLTARSVQQQLGVDQPDFGTIWADRVHGDSEPVSVDDFIAPRAEVEIALVLGRDIPGEMPGWPEVLRSIDFVMPAIEIVDSRVVDWDIRFVDTVADNASFGACMLGGPARRIEGLELALCGMVLESAGEPVSTGAGAACLGHPLNAAVWLARKMAALGTPLSAGDLVMTGALGPMVPIAAGEVLQARVEGVGSLTLNVE